MRSIVKTALVLLASLFMALRVVAHPIVMNAPGPGLVALCTNGQIVFFSLETGQPIQPETGKLDKACPYAGLTAFNVEDYSGPVVDVVQGALGVEEPIEAQVLSVNAAQANKPRAPPAIL